MRKLWWLFVLATACGRVPTAPTPKICALLDRVGCPTEQR